MRLVILGGGKLGRALYSLLKSHIHTYLWSRRSGKLLHQISEIQDADVIILCVSDHAIPHMRDEITKLKLKQSVNLLHSCGSMNAEKVFSGKLAAFSKATMHPLVAIRSAEKGEELLPIAHWAIEGDELATKCAEGLVKQIGAKSFRIQSEKMSLYHLAAVIASNHSLLLWAGAKSLLEECELGKDKSEEILAPLIRSTVENYEHFGLPAGLTGPLMRGDDTTIDSHLNALDSLSISDLFSALRRTYLAELELGIELLKNGKDFAENEDARQQRDARLDKISKIVHFAQRKKSS